MTYFNTTTTTDLKTHLCRLMRLLIPIKDKIPANRSGTTLIIM